ncbi:MAG: diaminopimelate decarboxylase [Gammaproteobacteria bacterium]
MDYFNYQSNELYAEQVSISDIVRQYGTPCYVYSRATLERHWHAFNDALGTHPHRICYAVKANGNLAILNLLARLGSSFDIVSIGELERVLAAGGKPQNIIFSGVGKRRDEIRRALEVGIFCFNVESIAELERINQIAAELNIKAPIALRINPDVDPQTHPYISTGMKENKFGIAADDVVANYQYAASLSHIAIKSIACHIGSQLLTLTPFLDALERVLALVEQLKQAGIELTCIDLGGGLGVTYHNETPPTPAQHASAILQRLANSPYEIILEPGRAIMANAGILVTRVEYIKNASAKNFVIVDAAMTELLRPALYQAWHNIVPVKQSIDATIMCDIVGPVCESADRFARDRQLAVKPDDLLAIRSCGAYGAVMSSDYNARPRVPEVMVDGDQIHLIRPRQTMTQLFATEKMLP